MLSKFSEQHKQSAANAIGQWLMVVLVPHELWCVQAGAAAVQQDKWAREVCLGHRQGGWHAYSPSVPSHGVGAGSRAKSACGTVQTGEDAVCRRGAWSSSPTSEGVSRLIFGSIAMGRRPEAIAGENGEDTPLRTPHSHLQLTVNSPKLPFH